jgi:HlyD family secretion protein
MRSNTSHRQYVISVVLALVAVAAILGLLILRPGLVAPRPPGVVQSTEIKIAPEISGRLARFTTMSGQEVHRGEVLAELSNPELEAALLLARAQVVQARAERDRVYAGPRQEQVDTLQRQIEVAKANVLYSQQQFARTSKLAADGFASRQDLDKATSATDTSRAELARAQELYEAARLGPTQEERALADAKVESAAAAAAVVAARVAKLRVSAQSDGIVALLVAEPGEAIVPGQPVMTLQATGKRWASFNVREDQLGDVRIGSPVELIPDNGAGPINAKVDELTPRGEFATWRAARAVGDYDLNTFLIRVDADSAPDGLESGMTVWMRPR